LLKRLTDGNYLFLYLIMNKDIIFGMPSLIEFKSLEENIGLCNKLGLKFIELNMNLPQFQVPHMLRKEFRNSVKNSDLFFTLHLQEEINIADFNEKIKEAYVETVCDAIEVAKECEMPILNMHMNSGIYFTLPNKKEYLFEQYSQSYMDNIKKFAEIISKKLKGAPIKICIENTGNYDKLFITNAVSELLRYDCFRLTWDIGHDHSSGNKDAPFILKNIKYLQHMHIHDAIKKENHLPAFTGEIDMKSKLEIAKKYNCRCVLETKTVYGLEKSVKALKKINLL